MARYASAARCREYARREKTTIGSDQYAAVDNGKLTPRKAAVRLGHYPSNSGQIVDPGSGVTVAFSWQDPEGNPASSYHLQISRSPIFASDRSWSIAAACSRANFVSPVHFRNLLLAAKSDVPSGQRPTGTTPGNSGRSCRAARQSMLRLACRRIGGNVYLVSGITVRNGRPRRRREAFAGPTVRFGFKYQRRRSRCRRDRRRSRQPNGIYYFDAQRRRSSPLLS